MVEYVNIKDIRPADYNPREITDEQFEQLKQSITELGMVMPVLINKSNGVIVAGHQRTKACTALGIQTVPAVYISNLTAGDEISLNQIHNGTDENNGKTSAKCNKPFNVTGYTTAKANDFTIQKFNATIVKEISRLLTRYGNILSCIICDKDVIKGASYIKACECLNMEVNCYVMPPEQRETGLRYIHQDYGTFSYDHLKKDTFVQGLAQMQRRTKETTRVDKKQNASHLYEQLVLPKLMPNESILDFGCGKGAYINMLKKTHDAVGVEFYNNNGNAINVTLGNQQITELVDHLNNVGLFDVVVCDSVLNSVDSMQAENSVIGVLNAVTKLGGRVYISGRRVHKMKSYLEAGRNSESDKTNIAFLDKDNFTANYRKGKWYYQHFHDDEIYRKLERDYGLKVQKIKQTSSAWRCECIKVCEVSDLIKSQSIEFEFSLPLPNGKCYNRSVEVLQSLGLGV